jgi:hypothetical protein
MKSFAMLIAAVLLAAQALGNPLSASSELTCGLHWHFYKSLAFLTDCALLVGDATDVGVILVSIVGCL